MAKISVSVILATCAVICTGLPVSKDLPVLKQTPKEVLFRVSETHEPFLLECVVVGNTKGVKYTWQKNAKTLSLDDAEVVQRHDEGSLVFLKPSSNDAGQYQCFATTELGIASTGIINVKQAYIKAQTPGLQKVNPVEAKPFKLDCPIPDSYPKPEISWRYQAVNDPEISNEVMDPRITVSPEGTLYITSIDKKDANKNFKYVCMAKTPATPRDVILAEYMIEEVLPNNSKDSEVSELYTSKDMTVRFGDRTYLYCIFGGIPQAHPDWFKDGVDVNGSPQDRITRYNRSKGKRLLIRETWLTDSGIYKCVANNEVGKPKEHSMKLTVVAAPHAQNMPSASAGVEPGKDITIPCQSTGLPAPKLTWTYNAQPLEASERIIINYSTKGNLTVADLTIKGAKTTDKGYYGCKADNEYGNLYGETVLNVA